MRAVGSKSLKSAADLKKMAFATKQTTVVWGQSPQLQRRGRKMTTSEKCTPDNCKICKRFDRCLEIVDRAINRVKTERGKGRHLVRKKRVVNKNLGGDVVPVLTYYVTHLGKSVPVRGSTDTYIDINNNTL
jgi:hypothetical protein